MYQLVLKVVDWKSKKVIAFYNFLHSAVWKIKDLIVIDQSKFDKSSNYKNDDEIKFITVGVQHLS
jgi:hypothetical protein